MGRCRPVFHLCEGGEGGRRGKHVMSRTTPWHSSAFRGQKQIVKWIVVGAAVLALFALHGRASALDSEAIARLANEYESQLTAQPGTGLMALIDAAKAARVAGDDGAERAALEAAASHDDSTYQVWRDLASFWNRTGSLDFTLAAGYHSYNAAKNDGERLDTLHILTDALRRELADARAAFDAVQDALLELEPDDYERAVEGAAARDEQFQQSAAIIEAGLAASQRIYSASAHLAVVTEAVRDLTFEAKFMEREVASVAFTFAPGEPEKEGSGSAATSGAATPRPKSINRAGRSRTARLRTQNRVDAEPLIFASSDGLPRICVQFTLPLNEDAAAQIEWLVLSKISVDDDFSRMPVEIDAIEIQATQLCLYDVVAGERYELTIKEGLQAAAPGVYLTREAIGLFSDTGKAFEYTKEIAVPDKPSLLTFTPGAFVLPLGASGVVPLNSQNIAETAIFISRISDRNLYRHIALNHIDGTMGDREFNELLDWSGDRIFEGALAIDGQPNEVTSTSLPLVSILDEYARRSSGAESRSPTYVEQLDTGHIRGAFMKSGPHDDGRPADEDAELQTGVFAVAALEYNEDGEARDVANAMPTHSATTMRSNCRTEIECRYRVQWIVRTNIGLTIFEGENEMRVAARSFSDGAPIVGAEIQLIAKNNRVLGAQRTDAGGFAVFPARLAGGTGSNALVAAFASKADDFSFVRYGRDKLDLSLADVDGRVPPSALDAYLYTDRGSYRPGEDINAVVLFNAEGRDGFAGHLTGLELTLSDSEVVRATASTAIDSTEGPQRVEFTLPDSLPLGTYTLTLSAPDQTEGAAAIPLASVTVQIESRRRDRARLRLVDADAWRVAVEGGDLAITGSVFAQYLHAVEPPATEVGRIARNPHRLLPNWLSGPVESAVAEISVRTRAADSPVPGCYRGFAFGPLDKPVTPSFNRQITTLADGVLRINETGIELPRGELSELLANGHPLEATVSIMVRDSAGPLAQVQHDFPVRIDRSWIGVSRRPIVSPSHSPPGAVGAYTARFPMLSFDTRENGERRGVSWRLFKRTNALHFRRAGTSWRPVTGEQLDRIRSGDWTIRAATKIEDRPKLCLQPNADSDLTLRNLPAGRYVLEVREPRSGATVRVPFNTGAQTAVGERPRPDEAQVWTDKSQYSPGERIEVNVAAPFEGDVTVAIVDSDIRDVQVSAGGGSLNHLTIESIPEEWAGRGLYALATVNRRLDERDATGAAPARAIGAAHFSVRSDNVRALDLRVDAPSEWLPQTAIDVSVCVADGERCSQTAPSGGKLFLFVVDEGLLGLTAHPAPDPAEHFFGRRQIGINIYDNYGNIVPSVGGDRPSFKALNNYTSRSVVSELIGPIALDQNGSATVSVNGLDLTSGTVRFAAIAWFDDAVGAGEAKTTISAPVTAELIMPSFLSPEDEAHVPIVLSNERRESGETFDVSLSAGTGARVEGFYDASGNRLTDRDTVSLQLPRREMTTIYARIALTESDREAISFDLSVRPAGPQHRFRLKQRESVALRAPVPFITGVASFDLAAGETMTLPEALGPYARSFEPHELQAEITLGATYPVLLSRAEAAPNDDIRLIENIVYEGRQHLSGAARRESGSLEALEAIVEELSALRQTGKRLFRPHHHEGSPDPDRMLPVVGFPSVSADQDLFRAALAAEFLLQARAKGVRLRRSFVRELAKDLRGAAGLDRRVDNPEEFCTTGKAFALRISNEFESLGARLVRVWRNYCQGADNLLLNLLSAPFFDYGSGPDEYIPSHEQTFELPGASVQELELAILLLSDFRKSGAFGDDVSEALDQLRAQLRELDTGATHTVLSEAPGARAQTPDNAAATSEVQMTGGRNLFAAVDGSADVLRTPFTPMADFDENPIKLTNDGDGPLTVSVRFFGRPKIASAGNAPVKRSYYGVDWTPFDPETSEAFLGKIVHVVVEATWPSDGEPLVPGADSAATLAIADLLPAGVEVLDTMILRGGEGGPEQIAPRGDVAVSAAFPDRMIVYAAPTPAGPGDAAIRFGYTVRVTAAGRFTIPPLVMSELARPERTVRSNGQVMTVTYETPPT